MKKGSVTSRKKMERMQKNGKRKRRVNEEMFSYLLQGKGGTVRHSTRREITRIDRLGTNNMGKVWRLFLETKSRSYFGKLGGGAVMGRRASHWYGWGGG